ncbi:MAG: di-trans,poly-cis-decaprenylcistransferase [Bifidobacteriaceae bacterium]|nr:di-trans,poly-cis-decaprenylcistransferase [Bifidobacteriaceae bacterium]
MPALPPPHPSGARAPALPPDRVPRHVAVVMDGNGRWAKARGLPRTEGHRAGENALVEVVAGAIEAGVGWLSAYAFSTENWKRSPSEVRFLMGYSRQVLRRRRDLFHSWNVRIHWAGQAERLWPSVIRELEQAVELTRANTGLNLTLCVNYGGRAEIARAARQAVQTALAEAWADGPPALPADPEQRADGIGQLVERALSEERLGRNLATPEVDLFWRTSGEARLSNFLLWESAYAELVFTDKLWPDVDRRDLWDGIAQYAGRARRYGAA